MNKQDMPDYLTYFLTGTVTDGRRWREVLNIAPEFISDSAITLIAYLAGISKDWDKRHDCKTVKFEFERPKYFYWDRDN